MHRRCIDRRRKGKGIVNLFNAPTLLKARQQKTALTY
jgi:hypothetical protein